MVRKETIEVKNELRGGKGSVTFHHVITEEEFAGHGRMYARLVLEPGSSIGWHIHEGETEPYYIIAGEGTFTDSDGSKYLVEQGDCCIIEAGCGHSIENTGSENLEFMALIYNVEK